MHSMIAAFGLIMFCLYFLSCVIVISIYSDTLLNADTKDVRFTEHFGYG